MALFRLQLRRLRSERVGALALLLLLFITALLLALGPRLLERLANEALVTELAAAPSGERNLLITEQSRISARQIDTVATAQQATLELERELPAEVRALVADRRFVADTTSWEAISGTQFEAFFFLRAQEGIEEHVTLISGRFPDPVVSVVPDPRTGALPNQLGSRYEVMLSQKTADELGLAEGRDVPLTLATADPRNVGVGRGAVARIVGIYRLTDEDDPYWLADPLVAGFRFHNVGSNHVFVESDAIVNTAAFDAMASNAHDARLPLVFQWRYYLDIDRIDATRSSETVAALRRLSSRPPHSGVSEVPTDTSLRAGLLRLMLAHDATWRSAIALLAVVGIGALFVAVTCLSLVATLASAGRRRTAALVLARGASPSRLRLALAAEALVVAVPAVVLAAVVAIALVPAAAPLITAVAVTMVAVVASALLVSLAAPAAGSAVGRLTGREAQPSAGLRRNPRRLVVEGALVIGAIAGAIALRDRGLAAASGAVTATPATGQPETTLGGADPLMIAVPALLGLAAGVLVLRGYPVLTGVVARLAAWRRGLVLTLASRRAARGRTSAAVLLTLVATASVGGFAAAAYSALDSAAQAGAWRSVGAAFLVRAQSGQLPVEFDPTTIDGVTRVAFASTLAVGVGDQPASLIALDAGAYQALTAGTPADRHFPADLTLASAPAGGVLPAIASANLGMRAGSGGAFTVGPRSAVFRVAAVTDAFPLAAADDRFLIVARDQLAAVEPAFVGPPNAAFIGAQAALGPALAGELPTDGSVTLVSRAEAAAALAATPVARAVSLGLAAAAIAAAAYAALAVAAALVLASSEQRTETAYLRVMGLTRGQRLRLIFAEHIPAALAATIAGAALGIGLFLFVRPGLGLPTIMPGAGEVTLAVDPQALLALLGAALLIVIPAWALAAFAQREPDPAAAVREGSA